MCRISRKELGVVSNIFKLTITNILTKTKTKTTATQGGVHRKVDQLEHIHRSFGSQKNGGDYQTRWRGHPSSSSTSQYVLHQLELESK